MYLILAIQKETLHVGCYFSFVHCLFRRGGKKTSLKSRREQSLKVTSGKTVRPKAGALPAPPAPRGRSQSGLPAGSLGCALTARGSSRQSHPEKGGFVMMAARGRRLLSRSLSTPLCPGSFTLPTTPGRAGPARTRPPRTAAHRVPAPPHPRRAQSPERAKQTTRPPPPSFLSPLTAWPPATLAVHAPKRRSLWEQSAPGPSWGPPGDPPTPAPRLTTGGLADGGADLPSGVKVAIMQTPPLPLAGPARQGGVPSSPCLPALAPAPLPFFSSRTWELRGSPGSPRLQAYNSLPARAGLGTPPASRVRAAPAPAPRGSPRTFPTADPPRPVAVPARPAPPRQEDALCSRRCGRRSRRARRGRSGAGSGGRGREAGVAAVPEPPPLSRPAPARPSPTRT